MIRRVLIGGLDTRHNISLPPEDLHLIQFGKGSVLIKSEDMTDEDKSVSYVHLNKPNNLVIADIDWLLDNLEKIKRWKESKDSGSWIHDCWLIPT